MYKKEYAGTVAYAYIAAQAPLMRIRLGMARLTEQERSAVSAELFKQIARNGGDERVYEKAEESA